MVRIFESKPCE